MVIYKIIKILILVSGIALFATLSACGGGGGGSAPTVNYTLLNNIDGASGIPVGNPFKYTFAQAIDTTLVTSSTFFIVKTPVADISVLPKAAFNPSICIPENGIDASVSCLSSLECVLDPTSDLDPATSYTGCLSPAVLAPDGFMATFITEGTSPVSCTSLDVNDDFSTDSHACWTISDNLTWTSWDQILGDILTFDTAAGTLLYTPTNANTSAIGIYKEVELDGSGTLEMKVHLVNNKANIPGDSQGAVGVGIIDSKDLFLFNVPTMVIGIGDVNHVGNRCAAYFYNSGCVNYTTWYHDGCIGLDEIYVRFIAGPSSVSIQWSPDDINYTDMIYFNDPSGNCGIPANLSEVMATFTNIYFAPYGYDPGLGSVDFDYVLGNGLNLK